MDPHFLENEYQKDLAHSANLERIRAQGAANIATMQLSAANNMLSQAETTADNERHYARSLERLLSAPMAEIAENNKNFAITYQASQQTLADWMLSQKAFKELAFDLAAKLNISAADLQVEYLKRVYVIASNHNKHERIPGEFAAFMEKSKEHISNSIFGVANIPGDASTTALEESVPEAAAAVVNHSAAEEDEPSIFYPARKLIVKNTEKSAGLLGGFKNMFVAHTAEDIALNPFAVLFQRNQQGDFLSMKQFLLSAEELLKQSLGLELNAMEEFYIPTLRKDAAGNEIPASQRMAVMQEKIIPQLKNDFKHVADYYFLVSFDNENDKLMHAFENLSKHIGGYRAALQLMDKALNSEKAKHEFWGLPVVGIDSLAGFLDETYEHVKEKIYAKDMAILLLNKMSNALQGVRAEMAAILPQHPDALKALDAMAQSVVTKSKNKDATKINNISIVNILNFTNFFNIIDSVQCNKYKSIVHRNVEFFAHDERTKKIEFQRAEAQSIEKKKIQLERPHEKLSAFQYVPHERSGM